MVSCKEETFCFICSSEYRINGVQNLQGRKSNIYCDLQDDEIRVLERSSSFEFFSPEGDHIQISLKCHRKQ